jgi:hypothetical protein
MQTIQKSATPELNEKYFADVPAGQDPSAKSPEPGPK